MPTITVLKNIKYKQQADYKHENNSAQYYASSGWRNLRHNQLLKQPLCEQCLKEGRTTLATEVHHIQPFLTGGNEYEKWNLLLNENNLMSVCRKCHDELHRKLRRK